MRDKLSGPAIKDMSRTPAPTLPPLNRILTWICFVFHLTKITCNKSSQLSIRCRPRVPRWWQTCHYLPPNPPLQQIWWNHSMLCSCSMKTLPTPSFDSNKSHNSLSLLPSIIKLCWRCSDWARTTFKQNNFSHPQTNGTLSPPTLWVNSKPRSDRSSPGWLDSCFRHHALSYEICAHFSLVNPLFWLV